MNAASPGDYLEPSTQLRELQLLELLADTPETSQSALAERVGLTPARVNAYIRSFQERAYITTEQRPRGQTYLITPIGRRCLAYHQVSYRAELVRLTRSARSRFREYFRDLRDRGYWRIALYGAGETGEVVLDALAGSEVVSIVAVVDDDATKHGRLLRNVPVRPRSDLRMLIPDAVVITSITQDEQIRTRLAEPAGPTVAIFSLVG